MVLSILIAAIVAPGLLGSQEAIRQSQSKEKREEHRARRCNLIVTCVKPSNRGREINDRQIVLRNGRLWIDTGSEDGSPLGHPYAGYYLPYPDSKYEGLVTTITDVAPIMNWVYVDKETHEVRYGVRVDAQPNLTGPFDCTRQDRRMTFDGWEGWCAVEEAPGIWALYFDVSDDGLKSKVAPGTRVLEVELSRKEKRFKKEADARQQDQTTKRAVDAQEDAPVDRPLAAEALVSKPGVVDNTSNEEGGDPASYKPLKIPKSIFDDPPPLVQPLVSRPGTPKTPPPAYSLFSRAGTAGSGPTNLSGDASTTPTSGLDTRQDVEQVQTSNYEATNQFPLPNASDVPSELPRKPVTPPRKASASPPASLGPIPTSEKRITPKLNRSSGGRALAQAQLFEAMAAAQIPSDDLTRRTSKRNSRADSNAGSTSSVYSEKEEPEEQTQFISGVRPQASLEPAPLAPALSKSKAPSAYRPASGAPESLSGPSAQRPLPVMPPSRQTPINAADPAIFGAKSTGGPRGAAPLSGFTSSADPTTQRSANQRSISRSSNQTSSARQPRQRATLNQSSSRNVDISRSSPRPSLQAGGAQPQSLARTITTDKGIQGMANRMTGSTERKLTTSRSPAVAGSAIRNRARAATVGRKTTSALFREIDDLVSQDTGGSPQGRGNGTKKNERGSAGRQRGGSESTLRGGRAPNVE